MASVAEQYCVSSKPSSQETLFTFVHSLEISVSPPCEQAHAAGG